MTATSFVDMNVLLYAASNAAEDQPKRLVARQVLSEPGIIDARALPDPGTQHARSIQRTG